MIATSGKYVCKPLSDDKAEVILFLEDNIYKKDENLRHFNMKKLAKLIDYAKVLVCYKEDEIIGVCVFRYVKNYIDILHMYISKEHRATRGSGLINHYVINVLGKDCDVHLKSDDTTTFKDVIQPTGQDRRYIITDRARIGLKRYMKDKIYWQVE